MRVFKELCNYFLYCGIEKDEYKAVKKEAYVSNFMVWRILHFLMAALFGFLFLTSLFSELLRINTFFYIFGFVYSVIAIGLFFILKKESIIPQLLIYLSISMLFLFGAFLSQNNPSMSATTFIVFLLITPMFMIDKPYFMTLELCGSSAVFLIWMYNVKSFEIWRIDLVNVVSFTVAGIFLNIISNAIRIREFVLTRKINIQKDTDEMTGLKNKGALTRKINEFLADDSSNKAIMFMLDIDRFKSINDTFGHDIGDSVISQLGSFLASKFPNTEIVGRFGGDEFIVFVKNSDDKEAALKLADEIVTGATEKIKMPVENEKVSISIGIAIYNGIEKNYSELFKKSDLALYKAKADSKKRFYIYSD